MNLNRRRNKGGDSDDGMSSMTDLVFLMLIFFIIMSTMAKSTLPVDLPSGKGGSGDDPLVEVAVNANDEYFIDANQTAYYTIDEIVPILEAKIAEQSTPGLKISGDKKASYEAIFNLIAVAKEKNWKPVLSYKN